MSARGEWAVAMLLNDGLDDKRFSGPIPYSHLPYTYIT